jgi:hypothetical protein
MIGYLIKTSSLITFGSAGLASKTGALTPNAFEILSIHYPLVVESSAHRSHVSFSSLVAMKQNSPNWDPPTLLMFLTEIAPRTLISVLVSV